MIAAAATRSSSASVISDALRLPLAGSSRDRIGGKNDLGRTVAENAPKNSCIRRAKGY